MIAFNNAKEMEANGEQGSALMAEYERVINKLGQGPFTEAQNHIRKEVFRNLYELSAVQGDEEKANHYKLMADTLTDLTFSED